MKRTSTAAPNDELPMEYTGARRLGRREWDRYRYCQARHRDQFPDYDRGWRRPTVETAERIWALLVPADLDIKISDLLPDYEWLRPNEVDDLGRQAMQALVVALDAARLAGDAGRMLTTNTVFDALAATWSDHYRACVETGRAAVSYDMKKTTVRATWRDLLRNGIRLDAFVATVSRGCPGLYSTKRISTRGRTVTVETGSPALEDFLKTVDADPNYRRPGTRSRLLLAAEPLPPRRRARQVAAEWAYNVVETGKRSDELIRRLEAARVYLDVLAFMKDATRLEQRRNGLRETLWDRFGVDATRSSARPRGAGRRSPLQWGMKHVQRADIPTVRALYEQYQSANGQFLQIKDIREQLQRLGAAGRVTGDSVEIRSGFSKVVNRRYHPLHFWPVEVSGKDVREELVAVQGGEDWELETWELASRRGRWFSADAISSSDKRARTVERLFPEVDPTDARFRDCQPLVGFDVSSSQLQILAVLLGLADLEAEVTTQSFKEVLAGRVWRRHADSRDTFTLPSGFAGPTDPNLAEAIKVAVMTRLYGSEPETVARNLTMKPGQFGPGLGDAANVRSLFDKTVGLDTILEEFLPACQMIAARVCDADPYGGVVFIDPYDGARVRWNPILRRMTPVTSEGTRLYVSVPVGCPNAAGEYPVDTPKLSRVIAPCLTQMLDAAFAGYVVEALNARGVRDVVSVHDCWMVPAEAEPVLRAAVLAAGEPWLQSLGPVYDALIAYLTDDPTFGPKARRWKSAWQRRVGQEHWPRFLVTEPLLWRQEARPV